MISKSTIFIATAIAAGLVSAARGLPGPSHPTESTGHMTADRPAVTPDHYATCAALHRSWPHGVGRASARDRTSGHPVTAFHHSRTLYAANASLDTDDDHIACEAN